MVYCSIIILYAHGNCNTFHTCHTLTFMCAYIPRTLLRYYCHSKPVRDITSYPSLHSATFLNCLYTLPYQGPTCPIHHLSLSFCYKLLPSPATKQQHFVVSTSWYIYAMQSRQINYTQDNSFLNEKH